MASFLLIIYLNRVWNSYILPSTNPPRWHNVICERPLLTFAVYQKVNTHQEMKSFRKMNSEVAFSFSNVSIKYTRYAYSNILKILTEKCFWRLKSCLNQSSWLFWVTMLMSTFNISQNKALGSKYGNYYLLAITSTNIFVSTICLIYIISKLKLNKFIKAILCILAIQVWTSQESFSLCCAGTF